IEELPEVVHLDCTDCIRLTEISEFPALKYLTCSGCSSLTTISHLLNLNQLFCKYCRALIDVPEAEFVSHCTGCTWLNVNENKEYSENLKSLRSCQAMWKRKVIGRKLEKLI